MFWCCRLVVRANMSIERKNRQHVTTSAQRLATEVLHAAPFIIVIRFGKYSRTLGERGQPILPQDHGPRSAR